MVVVTISGEIFDGGIVVRSFPGVLVVMFRVTPNARPEPTVPVPWFPGRPVPPGIGSEPLAAPKTVV